MEEIKAGDIMLGNLFIGYDGKPFQWKGYHFGMIENEVECVTIDEIIKSAIPLTEDILLKAGFEELYKSKYTRKLEHKEYSFIEWIERPYQKCIYYNNHPFEHIEYLHQLQNLFKSLTGNDLKIEV